MSARISQMDLTPLQAQDIPSDATNQRVGSAFQGTLDNRTTQAIDPTGFQRQAIGANNPNGSVLNIDTRKDIVEQELERYVANAPKILFTSEYLINGEFKGVLIAWNKYLESTHYELFKKNYFSDNTAFERILFLTSRDLEEETKHYIPYLKDVLGFDDLSNDLIVVLDTVVKKDRIYSYKISAKRVPENADQVDYDFLLENKGLMNKIPTNVNDNNIFDAAFLHFGNADYAWILSLCNDDLIYFGKGASTQKISDLLPKDETGQPILNVPKDIDIIIKILSEAIGLFGTESSLNAMLKKLKGLPTVFFDIFLQAFDEQRQVFSYDKFVSLTKEKFPYLDLILQLSTIQGTDTLTLLEFDKNFNAETHVTIIAPVLKGDETVTSLVNLTKILKFINNTILSVLYVQDTENLEALAKTIKDSGTASSQAIDLAQRVVDAVIQIGSRR